MWSIAGRSVIWNQENGEDVAVVIQRGHDERRTEELVRVRWSKKVELRDV